MYKTTVYYEVEAINDKNIKGANILYCSVEMPSLHKVSCQSNHVPVMSSFTALHHGLSADRLMSGTSINI